MEAYKVLEELGVYECPECHCATGDDWEYRDFSNRSVITCPQCNEDIYLEQLAEVQS